MTRSSSLALLLGAAAIRGSFVRGEYPENDLYVFSVNVGWKSLPWSGLASWAR